MKHISIYSLANIITCFISCQHNIRFYADDTVNYAISLVAKHSPGYSQLHVTLSSLMIENLCMSCLQQYHHFTANYHCDLCGSISYLLNLQGFCISSKTALVELRWMVKNGHASSHILLLPCETSLAKISQNV